MARPPLDPNVIYTQGVNRIQMAVRFSAVDIIKQALELGSMTPQQTRNWKIMLEALRSEAIPRSARQEMWDRIGAKAQRSLIAAYAGRRMKREVMSYRMGDQRFSNGALAKALAKPGMYLASPTGLSFINRQILDAEAKHWRRLNFGAGAGGQERGLTPPGRFEVRGLGLMMGLQPDVRPGFWMPAGMWVDRSRGVRQPASNERVGRDAFYLASRSAALTSGLSGPSRRADGKKFTRGIAARNFMDAPIKGITADIKPGLDRLWREARKDKARSQIIREKTGVARLPKTL